MTKFDLKDWFINWDFFNSFIDKASSYHFEYEIFIRFQFLQVELKWLSRFIQRGASDSLTCAIERCLGNQSLIMKIRTSVVKKIILS